MTFESPFVQESVGNGAQDRPLLSVVTIAKDNPFAFMNTARSVSRQADRLKPHCAEWIVVNGSTQDDSVACIAADYADIIAAQYHEPDNGLYDAMNKGLSQVRGHYVTFLNAGDMLPFDDTLKVVADTLAQNPSCDFLYGDYYYGMQEYDPEYKKARPAGSGPDMEPMMTLNTSHQAMYYRTDLLQNQRYDTRYKIAADYVFTSEFLKKAGNAVHVPQPLARVQPSGVSETKYMQSLGEIFIARNRLGMPFADNAREIVRGTAVALLKEAVPAHVYQDLRKRFGANARTQDEGAARQEAYGPSAVIPINIV